MKILGTGLSGLVGSRIVELLSPNYSFDQISRSTGVDIRDYSSLFEKVKSSDAEIVLHMAAKANVDACEEDKSLGETGEAWEINVVGTANVVKAAQETNKKVVYISTDFVFDGAKNENEQYTEEDMPNPINWYARTKYEGEKIVQTLGESGLIVRIAYPYRSEFSKNDFVRGMLSVLKEGKEIKGVTDHLFCPTYVDDIAVSLDCLIQKNASGIYHVVGSQVLTPFDAAVEICKTFNLDKSLIVPTTREEFFTGRAARPYNLSLKNDKISKLGATMRTFDQGLKELMRLMN